MPKDEWGTKRVCPTTGKRFYDLNKTPIISPYTGDPVVLDAGKGKRSLVADKADAASKKEDEAVVADEEDIVLDDDDDDDADVDLGDDVLEDDDDDADVSLEEIADVAADDDD